jgi:hypothetical protein
LLILTPDAILTKDVGVAILILIVSFHGNGLDILILALLGRRFLSSCIVDCRTGTVDVDESAGRVTSGPLYKVILIVASILNWNRIVDIAGVYGHF